MLPYHIYHQVFHAAVLQPPHSTALQDTRPAVLPQLCCLLLHEIALRHCYALWHAPALEGAATSWLLLLLLLPAHTATAGAKHAGSTECNNCTHGHVMLGGQQHLFVSADAKKLTPQHMQCYGHAGQGQRASLQPNTGDHTASLAQISRCDRCSKQSSGALCMFILCTAQWKRRDVSSSPCMLHHRSRPGWKCSSPGCKRQGTG